MPSSEVVKPDKTARAVRLVARLLSRPQGQTCRELAMHFGWHERAVAPLLAWLLAEPLIERHGTLYRAANDATTRVCSSPTAAASARAVSPRS